MHFIRIIAAYSLIIVAAALSGCGGPGLKNQSPTASYRDLQAAVPAPGTSELIVVDGLLKQASKSVASDPVAALDSYLQAAERTVAGAAGNGPEAKYYRHATGQAVALLLSEEIQPSRYQVSYVWGKNLLDPTQFDSVSFADAIELEEITATSQEGIGAPMVCSIDYSAKEKKSYPFLHQVGISAAATALIDFPSKGRARISLYDTRRSDRAVFRGKTQTLASNFTAPLVSSADHGEQKLIGMKGILRPAAFFDEMGLYSTELPDLTKIPVVFTHGLGSRPATWITPYNSLLGEKWFRENYQVYAFYYPTGLPPMYPAAGLRQELERMHRELKSRGAGRNADRVILVGHSMGGLMTSFQIRDFRGTSDKIFISPIKELPIAPTSRTALLTMLESPPPRFVKRAVFMATPHRGSVIANNWLGRFGSSISKVPKQLLGLQFGEATRSLTTMGRGLVLDADPLDGIARLKAGNPLLTFTLERPVAYGTPYHSIIGDRGKGGGRNRGDDPESTDGTVAYWSAHLEGAVSEKIVPSDHGVQRHPEGIAELKRVFRLHLGR